jgi:Fe-S-cluster containining protein
MNILKVYQTKFIRTRRRTTSTELLTKTKIGRLINSFFNKQKGRKGQCTPHACETLDGSKGVACCKLGFTCPFLSSTTCGIYKSRPRNCRVFPANEEDLKLVKNCGYRWE